MPIVVIILGVIIVALGAAVFLVPKPAETPTPEEAPQTETIDRETEENLLEMEAEANLDTGMIEVDGEANVGAGPSGTYNATGNYLTPARTAHEIAVSLTLEDGIVTAADVVYDGGEGYSNPNQENFDGAFEAEVVGKPLSEISLSRVGGASLTSGAFNDAVAKISAQAS